MEKQEVTYLVFFVTVIFFIILIFFMAMILNYYRRNKKYNHHLVEIQFKKEQEILKSQLEIQEQTFKNISQEIHDNIGQVLSLVKLNINTMDCGEPISMKEKITDSRVLITKAIQDLRDLSKSLNTDYVSELGLSRAIEYELEMIRKAGCYNIQFEMEGHAYKLENQQALILFRIVQEILHNILKHARATKIEVAILYSPKVFSLTIKDDGIGFNAADIDFTNYSGLGLGLRNMHNRALIINSEFNLISNPGKGTTIQISLPLQNSKS